MVRFVLLGTVRHQPDGRAGFIPSNCLSQSVRGGLAAGALGVAGAGTEGLATGGALGAAAAGSEGLATDAPAAAGPGIEGLAAGALGAVAGLG